ATRGFPEEVASSWRDHAAWGGSKQGTFEPRPSPMQSHVCDDVIAELAALDLRGAFHQAREIVGHPLAADRAIQTLDDQVRSLVPAHVAKHHLAAKDHAPRIDHVLAGILRRRTVRRFED